MPIITRCTELGCETLTMGPLCMEHDSVVERSFVRGRPFVRPEIELHAMTTTTQFATTFRTASERAAAVPSLR